MDVPVVSLCWWRTATWPALTAEGMHKLPSSANFETGRCAPWGDGELLAAVQRAREWLVTNPAPDEQLARDIAALLDAYSQLTNATVPRLQELREIIDLHNKAILEWEATLDDS